MGTTTTYLIPYPELDEPDDVPADMKQLADRLEALLPGFQLTAGKGTANGYAGLDSSGKVPAGQLPSSQVLTVLRKATETKAENTAAKTDLLNGEFLIPANALTATGIGKLVAWGDLLSSGSNRTLALSLTLGPAGSPVTLWDSGPITINNATNRRSWRLELELAALAAGSQRLGALWVLSDPTAAAVGTGTITDASNGHVYIVPPLSIVAAANLAVANKLEFTAQWQSATPNASMRLEYARMELT